MATFFLVFILIFYIKLKLSISEYNIRFRSTYLGCVQELLVLNLTDSEFKREKVIENQVNF